MTTCRLIATIGPPGSGKSTWRRKHLKRRMVLVNLDQNRRLLSCCGMDQDVTAHAVEMGVATARKVLADGGIVLWDATNCERASRLMLLVLAAEHGARAEAVVFLPPLAVTLARNARRDPKPCRVCGHARRVPDSVIEGMDTALRQDLPGLPDEGWRVRVGGAR